MLDPELLPVAAPVVVELELYVHGVKVVRVAGIVHLGKELVDRVEGVAELEDLSPGEHGLVRPDQVRVAQVDDLLYHLPL